MPAGNLTERLALCPSLPFSDEYTQYLVTSFLGPRQYIDVGPVNYTFFQFGPLQQQATGKLVLPNLSAYHLAVPPLPADIDSRD